MTTELKKLQHIVSDLEGTCAVLMLGTQHNEKTQSTGCDDANASKHNDHHPMQQDARSLHNIAAEFAQTCSNLRERTDKMLSRAREKDPDRQMYNEATCQKIEALGSEVDRVLNIVPEERLSEIKADFLSLIRREALEKAAAEHKSATLGTLLELEQDARFILADDEAVEYGIEFLDVERRERTEVYRIEGERAAAKWKKEQQRREAEAEVFKGHFKAARANPKLFAKSVHDALSLCCSSADGGDEEVTQQQQQRVSKNLVAKLREILDAISRDPAQEGLRMMRTDAERFVKTFGHSKLVVVTSPGSSAAHVEAATSRVTEMLLAGIGFVPFYTAGPMPLIWPGPGDGGGNNIKKTSSSGSFVSTSGAQVAFALLDDIPWIGYGDRRLSLQEPTVTDDPDEWMKWHETLKAVAKAF